MFSPAYIGYYDQTVQQHKDFASNNWQKYRPRSLSMYGSMANPLCAAIWVQNQPGEQYEYALFPKGNENELNSYINNMKANGYFPLHIAATTDGPYTGPLSVTYTAIFQKATNPVDLNFTFGTSITTANFGGLGGTVATALAQNFYPACICPLGRWTGANPDLGYRYAAVFRPYPTPIVRRISWQWTEQNAFEMWPILASAQAGMFRPTMLVPILNTGGAIQKYSVVWRDDSLIDWPSGPLGNEGFNCGSFSSDVANGLSADQYYRYFNDVALRRGWVLEVAAAGTPDIGPGSRFVAISAPYPYDRPFPRQWSIARADKVASPALPGGINPNPGGANPNLPGGVNQNPNPLTQAIPPNLDPWDQFMTSLMAADNVRGAQLAVVRDGKLAVLRAYTNAEKGYPVVKHTDAFRLASVSKVLTAIAIIRLAAIKSPANMSAFLNAPVSQQLNPMFPSYPNPAPEAQFLQTMTVGQLATHTAGLNPGPSLIYSNPNIAKPLTTNAIVSTLAGLSNSALQNDPSSSSTPIFYGPPGSNWLYSNFSFVMAQTVIDNASEANFSCLQFTQSNILKPIQVTNAHRAWNTLEPANQAGEVLFHSLQPKPPGCIKNRS